MDTGTTEPSGWSGTADTTGSAGTTEPTEPTGSTPTTAAAASWGARSPRWAGIRSETVEVRGTEVSLLRADGPTDGPVQLLIHGLGGSATNWLDVIGGLARRGPVIAPDLPGFGRTRPPRPDGTRIRANVGFLLAFADTLGIDRAEVHGNSMGGLLAVLLAGRAPAFVERLVLVNPALPGPWTKLHRIGTQTFIAFAPFALPRVGRVAMRRYYASRTIDQLLDENQRYVHGDPTRVSRPLREVTRENLLHGQQEPWRLDGFVAAAESLVASVLGGRRTLKTLTDVQAPTLLLWGSHDRLIGRPVVDTVAARRPDWDLHVFDGAGHAPMIEVPDDYLEVVASWLGDPRVAAVVDRDDDTR